MNMKFWNLDKIRVSTIFNLVLIINIFVLAFLYMNKVNEVQIKNEKIAELEKQIDNTLQSYEEIVVNQRQYINLLKENYKDLYNISLEVNEVNKELLKDNEELEDMNLTLMTENEDLADRVAVYEEYKIFMFREQYTSPRTDCSYDLLKFFEEQIKDKDVDCLPFYCSWIMIESTWNNHDLNPRSHANGLPQFLPGTGKNTWYELMGMDEPYDHYSTVCDPYNSIPMMVAYVSHLSEIYHGDLYKIIDSYRGLHDEPYLKRFNYYLSFFDLSIDDLAPRVRDRYLERKAPVG